MLSEALGLDVEGLSTLQRKLLVEFLQRRYPQIWSHFISHKYDWENQKKSLKEFIQSHQSELVKELVEAGLLGNSWKKRGAKRMSKAEHCKNPWNGKCGNTDIKVLIIYKGDRLPICRRCWSKIVNSNLEWGETLNNEEAKR